MDVWAEAIDRRRVHGQFICSGATATDPRSVYG